MIRSSAILMAALLAPLPWPAAGGEPAASPTALAPETGQELAQKLRSSVPPENAEYTGLLSIRRRNTDPQTVPLVCRIVVSNSSWQAIYQTAPTPHAAAEKLVIIHRPDRPNEYLYAQGSRAGGLPGEPVPLGRAQAAISLAGSDFWLLDLGLDFLHGPSQRVIKTEMRKGRVCQVLESLNTELPPPAYARVISWLDKETGGPLLAEAYDREDKLVKEFSIRSFKKVDGHWQLQDMEIRSPQTGSRTRIEFDLGRK